MINIEKNGRANVMVVGQPAWHKLGQVLANPATAEEAIREAGLGWEVEMQPMYLADGTVIPKRFATVRKDTNAPLGVVSDRYEVLQNTDAFKFFDSVVDEDEAIYHSAGVLGSGEVVWIMAKLPEHVRIKGIDDSAVYVTLMSGHDGKRGAMAFVHWERIVCNNTLQVALGQARANQKLVRFRHNTGIVDRVTNGAHLLGIVNQYKEDLADAFTGLANTKVDRHYTKAFIDALFPALPKEQVEKMKRTPSFEIYRGQVMDAILEGAGQDMPTAQGTAFGLFNGVTFFIDHMKKGHGDNASKKQSSIWFGDGARVRQRAYDLLSLDTGELKALATLPE